MPRKKIIDLPSVSTPLSGTETLPILQGGQDVKADAQDIADLAPAELPTQVVADASKFLRANGAGAVSYQTATGRLTNTSVRNMSTPNEGVLINEVQRGAITDGVIPKTLGGALASATISKVGQFDKLAVTGGNQGSFVLFNNIWLSDAGCKINLSVKVENLNKDGVTGTSYLGVIGYGLSFAGDTGSNWNYGAVTELIGKGMGFYGVFSSYVAANVTASSGTLVSNGDILDIETQFDVVSVGRRFKITNRNTGQYISAFRLLSNNNSYIYGGNARTARLGMVASNADFTILDFKVYSSVASPLASFVGDNYGFGYNQTFVGSLIPKLNAISPYQFGLYAANGASVINQSQVEVQEALKLNPRYVFLMSANLMRNDFISTNPGYPAYYTALTNMINQIIAKNAIPVLIKWPLGGQNSANYPQWYTFVDQQVLLFPQIKVLDLTSLPILYTDSFQIPSSNDFTLIANAVNSFLIAEGY